MQESAESPGGSAVETFSSESPEGSGPTLVSCLRSFFSAEQIEWECPTNDEGNRTDELSFSTPLREAQALMSRNVSFSGPVSWP